MLLKKPIISMLIALVIPLLISGPFLPDLLVSISTIFFLIFLFKKKDFSFFFKKPVIIFIFFCMYCILLSIFVAEDRLLSFESSLFYFRIGIFSCLIWYLIDLGNNLIKYFYITLLTCFSILVLDGYFQYFFGFNLIGFPHTYGSRISSFFGEELILGSYLSRLFPLMFAFFIIKENKTNLEKILIGILFILIDVLIFLSGERTAFVFLNLSTIFIIILIKEYKIFRLITFLIGFIIVLFLSLNDSELRKRMVDAPIQNMLLIENNTNEIEKKRRFIFTPSHDSLIKTAFNIFLDKPIFGHGPKTFRVKCKEKKFQVGISPCKTHPHNFYIQLLAETGIVGFLFLLSIFIYVLYCALRQFISIILSRNRYISDYQVCLLSCVFISVWPFAPNGNFFNNWLAIVYILPVGFYLQSIYGVKKPKFK